MNIRRAIFVGFTIGLLIGVSGMFAVTLLTESQQIKQIEALETQVEQLNNVVVNQQTLIDLQNDAIQTIDVLREEIQAKDNLIAEYEEYQQTAEILIEGLVEQYDLVNFICARQTYRSEEALTILQNYNPNYKPEVDFRLAFGNFTFTEWWKLYGGPFESWYQLVYP